MSFEYGYAAQDIVNENRVTWPEIETVKQWNLNANVPILLDEQVVGFLLSCDRDVEFTKKTILDYFRVRTYAQNLFNNRDIERPDLQLQLATL